MEKSNKLEKKVTKKQEDKVTKTPFFKGIKAELAKVKWPEPKNVVKYTIATLAFCLILGIFFEGLNVLSSFIKGLFS